MLTVKLLGGLSFEADGQRLWPELGSRGRLLAAYLLQFAGRVHRRERLSDLFWRDLDTEHARGALNTALWRLRRLITLEPASHGASNLYSSASEVVLERAIWLSVDTHCFDAAVQQAFGVHRSGDTEPDIKGLETASDDYSGPFLEGNDSDWIIAERERLHSLYVRCLSELVRAHAIAGRYELAIATARRILGVDPFRESVERALALLLTLNGQRAQAILELHKWTANLRREMGIGPMPETQTLERSIVSGRICDELAELKRSYFCDSFLRHGASGL